MWIHKIMPRFADTDLLGHITNAALPLWFEEAREPIFRIFVPDLRQKKWNLIMARMEFDFLNETFFGREVEIRTSILKIGNSSFTVGQQAWQDGRLRVKGKMVAVHFDFDRKKSVPIPGSIKAELQKHLVSEEDFNSPD